MSTLREREESKKHNWQSDKGLAKAWKALWRERVLANNDTAGSLEGNERKKESKNVEEKKSIQSYSNITLKMKKAKWFHSQLNLKPFYSHQT